MYTLPDLPYGYSDLEPFYSEELLRIHHDILHRNYVNNLNNVLGRLETARKYNNFKDIRALERDLSFNASGHILHTLFFYNLTPKKNTKIDIELYETIERDFESFDSFLRQFTEATLNIESNGWGILGYSRFLKKLLVLQCEKHQDLTVWGIQPLLVMDIWEHAYFLQYKTKKQEYLNNMYKIINWDEVNKRYKELNI